MIELGFVLGLVGIIALGAWWLAKIGAKAERAEHAEDALDAIDKAKEAERDARADDDPRERLRRDWKR